jgi:hypothetical protein
MVMFFNDFGLTMRLEEVEAQNENEPRSYSCSTANFRQGPLEKRSG